MSLASGSNAKAVKPTVVPIAAFSSTALVSKSASTTGLTPVFGSPPPPGGGVFVETLGSETENELKFDVPFAPTDGCILSIVSSIGGATLLPTASGADVLIVDCSF